jgi:L-rhamnose mutarotase
MSVRVVCVTETTIIRQEIRPDKVSKLKEWMEKANDRQSEIIETLQHEGVKTESTFLEESSDGTFLVTYLESEDLQEVQEAFEDSNYEIDVEYKELVQECLVDGQPVGNFEPLYHAANPDR